MYSFEYMLSPATESHIPPVSYNVMFSFGPVGTSISAVTVLMVSCASVTVTFRQRGSFVGRFVSLIAGFVMVGGVLSTVNVDSEVFVPIPILVSVILHLIR